MSYRIQRFQLGRAPLAHMKNDKTNPFPQSGTTPDRLASRLPPPDPSRPQMQEMTKQSHLALCHNNRICGTLVLPAMTPGVRGCPPNGWFRLSEILFMCEADVSV